MKWENSTLTLSARKTRGRPRKEGISGPGKRWGHTCNSVQGGKYIYVFGGYSKDSSHTNDVFVFDTTKQVWTKPMVKGTPPSPRDSHTCTTVGGNLFVFGGTDGKDPLGDLYILDTYSNTWTSPSLHGEKPEAREGHTAALIGKQLFIFGGSGKSQNSSDEVYYNDIYILDTESLEWRHAIPSGSQPSARDSHTCSTWKNSIIVVAGVDTSGHYLCDVHILDTDTLVWRELDTSGQILPRRAGHSTVALDRNLFVFGGFTDNRHIYDDLHMLNLETGTWTKVAAVGQGPSARFSVAGDCLDAQKGVLVFCGGCNAHLEASEDMYFLHTEISTETGYRELRPERSSPWKELKRKCKELVSVPASNTDVLNHGTVPDMSQSLRKELKRKCTEPISLPASDMNVLSLGTGPAMSKTLLLQSSEEEGPNPSGSVGKRGPARAKLSTSNGRKRILSTNEFGIPNGGDADYKAFISAVGVLARSNIPIIYKSFKVVPEEYKEKVIDTLSKSYEFEKIGGLGVDFVKYCMNVDWKTYKSNLHSKYIKDRDPAVVKELPAPRDIPVEDWRKFVDYCNSAEFKALSARNKVNRGKQLISCTLGRRSMAVVRHQMAVARNLKSDLEVSRGDVYVKAYTKKDGTVLCPTIASNLKEIESLDPDSRQLGENDSLTKAIGRDSRGRMRGLSGCISRSLVKKARLMTKKNQALLEEKSSVCCDVVELKQRYQDLTRTVEELKVILMAKQLGGTAIDTQERETEVEDTPEPSLQGGTGVDTPQTSVPSNQEAQSSDHFLIGKQCTIHGWAHRVIARGLVLEIDPTLTFHGKPIGEGNFKVYLKEVVDSNCLLWVPDGSHSTIGEVNAGGFVVWPRFLIEMNS